MSIVGRMMKIVYNRLRGLRRCKGLTRKCAVGCFGITILISQSASSGTIVGIASTEPGVRVQNAVVYIDSIPGKSFPAPEDHAQIDQKGLVFTPHILPVVSGTTVDFRNSDEVMHNVFALDAKGDKANFGSYPKGEVRSHTFIRNCDKTCDAVMLCNIHPEMEAYVVVLTNPYFGLTDSTGAYAISDVPPGEYTIRTWHERYLEKSLAVSVGSVDTVIVSFVLRR